MRAQIRHLYPERGVVDLLDHIEAIEAELDEAKAEISSLRGLSDLGWDVTERGKLEAQIRDLATLLRNENENYRRVNQELEEAKAEIARLKAAFINPEVR